MSSTAPTRELIPPEMDQHRVVWLTTEYGRGSSTLTRIRFATGGGKIYATLRSDSVGLKHIESHPQVRVALGKGNRRVRGSDTPGMAFVVPAGEISWGPAFAGTEVLAFPAWSRSNVPIEISLT